MEYNVIICVLLFRNKKSMDHGRGQQNKMSLQTCQNGWHTCRPTCTCNNGNNVEYNGNNVEYNVTFLSATFLQIQI